MPTVRASDDLDSKQRSGDRTSMDEPLVLLTRAQLTQLVREAVADVFRESAPAQSPRLLNKSEAAGYLRVSMRQMDLLR